MFDSSWYNSLISPALSPPNSIFMPVWIILYFLIFISLIIYVFKEGKNKKIGYIYFTIQLVLNLSWVPIFFGLKSILGGLIIIILLDVFIYLTIKKFYQISKLAGLLLVPYFIWTLFATYLNLGYLLLNNF